MPVFEKQANIGYNKNMANQSCPLWSLCSEFNVNTTRTCEQLFGTRLESHHLLLSITAFSFFLSFLLLIIELRFDDCVTSLVAPPHDCVRKLAKFEHLWMWCASVMLWHLAATKSDGQSKCCCEEPYTHQRLFYFLRGTVDSGLGANAWKFLICELVCVKKVWPVCYAYVRALVARFDGLPLHLYSLGKLMRCGIAKF